MSKRKAKEIPGIGRNVTNTNAGFSGHNHGPKDKKEEQDKVA